MSGGCVLSEAGARAEVIGVAVPPGAHERDLADLAGVEILLLRLQVMLPRPLLHADLADALVDPRRFDDRRPFFDRER